MTGKRAMFDWSEQEDETLKKLWADGLSAQAISDQMTGRSRNSVIGRVHRLALSGRKKTVSTQPRKTRPKVASSNVSRRPRAITQDNGSARSTGQPANYVWGFASSSNATRMRRPANESTPSENTGFLMLDGKPWVRPTIDDVPFPGMLFLDAMATKGKLCMWIRGEVSTFDTVCCGAPVPEDGVSSYCHGHGLFMVHHPRSSTPKAREARSLHLEALEAYGFVAAERRMACKPVEDGKFEVVSAATSLST